ncbi:MAG: response regulator [Phycisphaerales bacterium]|nr:response regulator [Phycisphaerales bacterium]
MSDGSKAMPGNQNAPSASSLVYSMPTPCAQINPSGRVEFVNAAWTSHQRRCVSLAGLGGNLIESMQATPSSTPAAAGLCELLDGRRADLTCDICVNDESDAWSRVMATRDTSGNVLVMLIDITDHPAAESRAASELRLQRIVESAMDGIITIDQRGHVVMFNAAAEKMFGVPAAQAIGVSLDRFIPSRTRDQHPSFIKAFGAAGVTTRSMGHLGAVAGVRADGTEFPIEASISHAQSDGQHYYTVILRDIAERKRLEAQLLQAQKMEGVGRLAGGIAHDFNNLIMAIFNYLALASRKLGVDHPVAPMLAQANQAAQRAADLTRQLLTFARKQIVAPRVLSPREVAAGLSPMLRRLIGEDVTLRTAFADDTGMVRADHAQLEQVLVNLVINARDAMPSGGTLTLETHNTVLDEAFCRSRVEVTPGEYVVFAVTDTGVGMTPEVQRHIFEPFFTTKPAGKGTGLGLAMCQGIVKQAGGHIGVYSEVGRGTSVRVYLPRVYANASPTGAAPVPKPPPRGSETILIAEDSALVRELVAEELRNAGYTVLSAESGPEALKIAAAHPGTIDVLLTDVVMPDMSGVQLAEKLAESRSLAVIYMSGYTEETITHHGVDPERVTFIAKPFMSDTLLHLVRRVIGAGAKK